MATTTKIKKIPLQLQVKFLHRFTELVEGGFAIVDALEIMSTLVDAKITKILIEGCGQGLKFSDLMKEVGFESQIVYIIQVSENHNALLRGLCRARDYSKNFYSNRKEISKKMKYPLFLLITVIFVLTTVFIFFLPNLDEFYSTFGIDGDHMAIGGIITVLVAVFVILSAISVSVLLVLKSQNEDFQKKIRKTIFTLPILDKVSRRLFSYYFASQIEMFIGCGLSFKESLTTIQNFNKLPLLILIAKEIEEEAQGGESIETIFKNKDCFTPYFKLIATHSLRIGQLDQELSTFIKRELKSLNEFIAGVIKASQGALLALVGIIVSLLYFTILQPVFDIITLI